MTVSKDGLSGLLLIGPQVIIVLAQCRIGIDNHVVTKMIRIGTVLPDNFRSKLIVRHTKRLQDMLDRISFDDDPFQIHSLSIGIGEGLVSHGGRTKGDNPYIPRRKSLVCHAGTDK